MGWFEFALKKSMGDLWSQFHGSVKLSQRWADL